MITDVDVGKLAELIVERDQLQAELTRLRAERSDLHNWFEHRHVTGSLSLEEIDAMSPKDLANHAYERKAEQVDALQSQLTDLRSQVDLLQADGAVMRQVMEACASEAGMNWLSCQLELSKVLQSTNAGRDLLARYREAVKLLNEWCSSGFVTDKWVDRRRDLLATVKGDL